MGDARQFHSRMTENRRLATAAPAIKTRITTRNRALVFCPWLLPERRVETPADMVG
jgi:hypothetical protein